MAKKRTKKRSWNSRLRNNLEKKFTRQTTSKLMKKHKSFIKHYHDLGYDPGYAADVVSHTQDGIQASKK